MKKLKKAAIGDSCIKEEIMKIALWNSENTADIIKKLFDIKIYVDWVVLDGYNNYNEDEIKTKNIYEALELCFENVDYLLIPTFLGDDKSCEDIKSIISEHLDSIDTSKIKWIPIEMIFGKSNYDFSQFIDYFEYAYLDYLEYKVCDNCNLNCRGCSHFANIVEPNTYRDYQVFKRDIHQLKKHIPHINKIRVLGGEPFLHPDILQFVKLFRKLYPFSDIRICTNAVLLSEIPKNDLVFLKGLGVGLDISVYPIIKDRIGKIESKLKECRIAYYLEAHNEFMYSLLESKNNAPHISLCDCKDINLYNGKLSPCPLLLTIHYYNEKFSCGYPENNQLIDIYAEDLTGRKILELLKKPKELCSYCTSYRRDLPKFKWTNSGSIAKEDWIFSYSNQL